MGKINLSGADGGKEINDKGGLTNDDTIPTIVK